jgi:hypothetical protein
MITFIGWEDRLGGDYDYNDLIFAFTESAVVTDRIAVAAVPEPITIAMFALGLAVLAGFRKRIHKA